MITEGKKVTIEYRVTLPDGTEVDSSLGEEALTFVQGEQDILPALEQALEGINAGEEKHLILPPQQAYGPIDDEYFQTVELELVPEDLRYKGACLSVEDDEGEFYKARLCKITQDGALLDFNHPLAGKTLVFDIWIVQVHEHQHLN